MSEDLGKASGMYATAVLRHVLNKLNEQGNLGLVANDDDLDSRCVKSWFEAWGQNTATKEEE